MIHRGAHRVGQEHEAEVVRVEERADLVYEVRASGVCDDIGSCFGVGVAGLRICCRLFVCLCVYTICRLCVYAILES